MIFFLVQTLVKTTSTNFMFKIYLAWIFLSMTTLIWQLNKKHNSLDKCTLNKSMHTNKRSTCDQNLNKKNKCMHTNGNNYRGFSSISTCNKLITHN